MSYVRTMDDFEAAQRYSDAVLRARSFTLNTRLRRTTTGDWYFKFRGWWWVRDTHGRVAACSPISTGNQPTRRATVNQYLNLGGLG